MTYDIFIIGAGSGGLAAAKAAAAYGAKVAIADPKPLGGTCVNRGCVPKKLMVSAANFVAEQHAAKSYGWVNPEGLFDLSSLNAAIARHIEHLNQSQQETLQELGIDFIPKSARFVSQNTLMVGDQTVEAQHIIIAVGGQPALLDMPGVSLALTSKDMFHLEQVPQQLVIVGGGYIGVEFSSIWAQLGSQVTLIDTDEKVLEGFDTDLRDFAQESLQRLGVNFVSNTTCNGIEKKGSTLALSLSGSTTQSLTTDTVLLAVGRKPNLTGLDLEKASIELDEGYIAADEYNQTSQSSVYAIGDCVGRLPLTPVAIAEGEAVTKTICCQQPTSIDYRWIPSAVFANPPIATVGWSEETARKHVGDACKTACQQFKPLSDGLVNDSQKSLIKWVFNKKTQQILGVHIGGKDAPEILQGLLPALKQEVTYNQLLDVIGIHPSSGEELFNLTLS